MEAICGAKCDECPRYKKNCAGCQETNGSPFGKKCFIAQYISSGGKEKFEEFKNQLIKEFNDLKIEGMPEIKDLYPLNGEYVNLEYSLPNGSKVKFLNDDESYLGNQVECMFNDGTIKKCFGIVGNMNFLLVSEYEENGLNPELITYKKR